MIFKNLVLIDGINRSGKNSIVDAVTSLKRSESIEMNYIFEHLVEGLALNLVSKKFAKSFFENFVNEIAYNKLLGRNTNFRKKDKSSIQNFSFPLIYKKRLLENDNGKKIFAKMKNTKNFFPFMTHEILPNLYVLDALDIKFKMIAMFRNPFDVIYSWKKKEIVKKFGKFNFTLSFKDQEKVYPWYVYYNPKKWLKLSEMDKIATIILDLINNSIKNYQTSKNKKNILPIKYEDYICKPNYKLKKICKFIKTNFSIQTKKKIKKLKLPVNIKLIEKSSKNNFNYCKKYLSPKLFKKIEKLEKSYKNSFYGFEKKK